jgi:hypothetical protein
MKNIVLVLILSGIIFSAIAQPVITQNNIYLIGDQTQIAWCNNATEPGVAGMNVTWDFSDLNEVEELVFDYVEPSSTVFGYQFPDATLCGVDEENYHSFYSLSNGFLTVEGYAGYVEGAVDTLKIVYTDSEQYIPIPFEFGDTHSDVFEGSSEILGFTATIEGELDYEADGYGTLILPNGTYENVIRYRLNRTQQNTVFGQTSTTTKEQWGWMSPDHRFWLCLMETNNDGFGTEDIVWYAKNPLILSNRDLTLSDVKVYPNPSQQGQSLYFESDFEGMTTIQIFSMDGKLVGDSNQFISMGQNEIRVTAGLSTGLYTMSLIFDDRQMVSKLIIK